MTIEQKAAAYDKLIQERDIFKHMAAEFLDALSSACYNGFNEAFKNREGRPIKTFGRSLKDIANDLRFKTCSDDYQVATEVAHLCDVADRVGITFDSIKGKKPAEIEVILPSLIDLHKAFKEAHFFDPELSKEVVERMKISNEELAYELVTFLYEFQFDHQYPGADISVYKDVFGKIVRSALANIGVAPTTQGMIEWALKYREKRS